MVSQLPGVTRTKREASKPKKLYRNPVILARKWQTALENGTYSCAADLARTLSVSRARVTQMLRLLRLHPEALEAIAALGDPLRSSVITERALRPIVNLAVDEQKEQIKPLLAKATQPEATGRSEYAGRRNSVVDL